MDVKKLYALMLIPILMLSIFASAIPVVAQGEEEAKKLAENMIMLGEKALNYAKSLIGRLRELGVHIPSEALEAIDNATTYLNIAKEALNVGNYEEAIKLALNAMKSSKHSVRTCVEACHKVGVNVTVIVGITEGNITVRKAFGLLLQIKWLREVIERFSKMNLTVLGKDTIAVEEELKELKTKLDEAEEKLKEGLVNETATILASLRKDLFKLIAEHHKEIAKIHMEVKLRNYIKHLKMFLLRLREKLGKLEENLKKLESEGVNVTVYVNKVKELNETITEVLVKIEAGNVTRETVVQIFVEIAKLHPKIRIIKVEEEIIPKLGERVEKAREILEKVFKIREEKLKKVIEKLREKLRGIPVPKPILEHLLERLTEILKYVKEYKHNLLENLEEIEKHLEEIVSEIDSVIEEAEGELGKH